MFVLLTEATLESKEKNFGFSVDDVRWSRRPLGGGLYEQT